MTTLTGIATLSLFAGTGLLGLHTILQRRRSERLRRLELIPNCLLTRHPILFVTGRRSIFYFLNYWNQIPAFLSEHGYDIEIIELPWRDRSKRMEALRLILSARSRSCHVIGDSSIEDELRETRIWPLANIVSVTVVQAHRPQRSSRVRHEDLKPRTDGLQTLDLPAEEAMWSSGSPSTWAWTWTCRFHVLLLGLHNLISFGVRHVHGAEIGLMIAPDDWTLERKFLDFAISLAERDARC